MRCTTLLILFISTTSALAQSTKLRDARAAAEAMIQPSGPVQMETAESRIPQIWRAQPRLAGTYRNYADRQPYTRTTVPWFYGWWYWYGGYYGYGWSGCR